MGSALYQLLAQQQLTSQPIPAFHVPDGSVVFHLEDVNPDKDVCRIGACLLAYSGSNAQQVQVYDASGAEVTCLPIVLVATLANMIRSDIWPCGTFATELRSLLYLPLHDAKKLSARPLFAQYFTLPPAFLNALL